MQARFHAWPCRATPYIRDKYTREVKTARVAARENFERFPKDRYETAVQSWRHLQCDNYEFTMRRLHVRSAARADETRKKVAGAEDIVVGDLSSIAETKSVAGQVNRLGGLDAVIHNAGIGYSEPKLLKTVHGVPQLFAVNTLAPYILTALATSA
jgi:short-subunit dehydrogenase